MITKYCGRSFALAPMAGLLGLMFLGAVAPVNAAEMQKMKFRGVVYDVGLRFDPGQPYSVESFNPALVKYDLHVIATELHATAVRIEGEEIDRLVAATRLAHAEGLSVFFNPWKMNVPLDELPSYFQEAARKAEELRKEGVDIVFVAGCETPIFNSGIFPGAKLMERIEWLAAQLTAAGRSAEKRTQMFAEKWSLLNQALRTFVGAVRAEFHGRVTYAATALEEVDWSLFDIVGIDYYRQGQPAQKYVAGLDRFRIGKPLVVMEVGCCTYVGAAARGAMGFMVLETTNPDGTGKFADGVVPTRSEREQANYVGEVLELLDTAGVDGTFIYVFSAPGYPTGTGARDLDLASFSLVKTFAKDDPKANVIPPWAPKEAFQRTAEFYQRYATAVGSGMEKP